jgi:membrane protease YdiL (CAAX protease family)
MPILLAICLAALAWTTWQDVADYAAFKQLTLTGDRQRRYRVWVLKSALLFLALPATCLVLLGRSSAIVSAPAEFAGASHWVRSVSPLAGLGPAFLGGMVGGSVSIGVFAVIWAQRAAREGGAHRMPTLGDIGALMPRNGRETLWTALMSLNAGVSEEIFFRLTLPLLITLCTGNAALAFVVASLIFGAAHVYQGWVGVAATTVLGFVFAGLYLATGSLLLPIAVHFGVDLMGLVVRPTLARLAARAEAA